MSFVKDLFSSPKASTAVDPSQLIGQQAGLSADAARQQARLNRPSTYTPFGSVTFEEMPGDRWQSTQTFSPEMQDLYGTQMQTGQAVSEAGLQAAGRLPTEAFSLEGVQPFRGEMDYAGLTDLPGAGDFETARTAAEEGAFSRVWDRLGGQFGEEETALETSLANKGITMGSQMYDTAFDKFNERKNDARTAAAYDSISAGREAFNNLFANALTSRQQGISERGMDVNLANIARQQQVSDIQMERAQPMNELAALLQGAPATQAPQAQGMAGVSVAPPDVGGAYGLAAQQAQNRYAGQISQKNAAMSGLFGLGAAAMPG